MTAVMAMLANPVYSQGEVQYYEDASYSPAYTDSGNASNMSTWIPIAALVAVGVIIAVSNRHHHHHHNDNNNSSSSHTHSSSLVF